jgi:hypothetical protein
MPPSVSVAVASAVTGVIIVNSVVVVDGTAMKELVTAVVKKKDATTTMINVVTGLIDHNNCRRLFFGRLAKG